MGLFSWKDAETDEDILHIHSGEHETVYLLQPNGENIEETDYEGYGEFGGIDAYSWLAEHNIDKAIIDRANALKIETRNLGIYIDYDYFIDSRNDKKYSYVFSKLFDDLNNFDNYGVEVDGVEVNQLIKDGIWVRHNFADYFGKVKVPLKLSLDDIDYNSVGASGIADNQGFSVEEFEDW